jgi:hypothetical protein
MRKWIVLFFLALIFDTSGQAWSWVVEMNARIYADGDVHVGCIHKRISDGKYCAEIVPEMTAHLLASETAALVEVDPSEIEGPPIP